MTRRATGALLLLALAAGPASAHFVFVTPGPGESEARVVFSDSLEPDDQVDIGKVAGLKLTLRRPGEKDVPLTHKMGEHCLTVALPGRGPGVVFGSVEYGIFQRGKDKPALLKYHPKLILGPAAGARPLGEAPAELVPVVEGGKVRFRLIGGGKPVADAEVTVMVPGKASEKSKTDRDGLTPEYAAAGRYGAWARHVEATSGKSGDKEYEEIRHYATLVVD